MSEAERLTENVVVFEVWSTGLEGEAEGLQKDVVKNTAEFQRRGFLRLVFCRWVRVHLEMR